MAHLLHNKNIQMKIYKFVKSGHTVKSYKSINDSMKHVKE